MPSPAKRSLDPVARQAIDWIVRQGASELSDAERRAFADWRASDPRHEAALAHLERSLGAFAELPGSAATRSSLRRALAAPGNPRRRLLKAALSLTGLGLGSALIAHRQQPLPGLLAGFSTATGERRSLQLADGSQVWLNARSAIDVAFSSTARHIRLVGGELIVDVAADPVRPLIVHTAEGTVSALGTRFLVRQEDGASLAAVLHASVRIDTLGGQHSVLHAGDSARFDLASIHGSPVSPATASAWEDGFVEVHDRPLGEVIAALRPYRRGFLRISPAAAALRVTGTFPLDDSERSLDALAEALPIEISRRTDLWVMIELA